MNIAQALSGLDRSRLDSMLAFWIENRHEWPIGEAARRDEITRRMQDREIVARKVAELPTRLRDLLRFAVRELDWQRPIDFARVPENQLPVAPFEVAAVAAALSDRGMLVERGRRGGPRAVDHLLPRELGTVLGEVFDASLRAVEASFSLRRYLRHLDRSRLEDRLAAVDLGELAEANAAQLLEELVRLESIEMRLAHVSDPDLRGLLDAFDDHGGILDVATCRRIGVEVEPSRLRAWGEELERLLLGSFEARELVNQGLGVGDGWLVVFQEVASTLLDRELVGDEDLLALVESAPDGFADLRGIIRGLEESPFRVRKTGEYYKTAVRRLAREALSPGHRPEGADADVLFLLDLMMELELVRRNGEGRLVPTTEWRGWLRKNALERGEDLLRWCRNAGRESLSTLHLGTMRRSLLDLLAARGVGVWLPIEFAVFATRNLHLAEASRAEYAARYQDRHKRAPFPPLATPDALRRSLERWLVQTPQRLGLVELARREGETRPFALRLSRFGARVMGLEVEEEAAPGLGLVVNSDFELILFPENTGYELIQEIGRFAERIKADYAIHYRLTRESVHASVAADFGETAILDLLRTHCSHELPENVVDAIRDWARRAVRLEVRRSWIVESKNVAAIERALETPELKRILRRRLAPGVLELEDDPSSSGAAAALRERGIHLGF
ncbi:MAG: helicase-associated domain-containing protein [Planctomycetota bacterium]